MAMTRMVLSTVAFTVMYIDSKSKEGMDQTLSFIQYLFVSHFKSTTPYFPIHYHIE